MIFEWYFYNDFLLKGKRYIYGRIEYEGEFLLNKKWNGKGYDENGNIIYELNNGNGKVKEYNYSTGEIIFEGEYLNGKRWNGKGKERRKNKLVEVEYLNGKINEEGQKHADNSFQKY